MSLLSNRIGYRWVAISVVGGMLCGFVAGCQPDSLSNSDSTSTSPANSAPLKVLVVDDTEFSDNLKRLWNAQSETKVETQVLPAVELRGAWDKVAEFDVVVYPSQMIGELASRDLLLEINPRQFDDKEFAKADVLPLELDRMGRWGDGRVAVSLGHLPWVLMYREDVLQAAGVMPPRTWAEYELACEKLVQPPADITGLDTEEWTSTVEPTQSEWLGHLLLARVASYASHRGTYCGYFQLQSGEPLIAEPSFVRALQELSVRHQAGSFPDDWSPESGWQRLVEGKCAMAIGWPANSASDSSQSADIRITALPGSTDVFVTTSGKWRQRTSEEEHQVPYLGYPGRLISVTDASRRSGTAWGFVSWLCQKDNQIQLSPASQSTFPTRYSLLPAIDRWLATSQSPLASSDLSATVREIQQQFVVMTAPRFPGSEEFLSHLSNAVSESTQGNATPQEALQQANEAWKAEIQAAGEKNVIRDIESSLGL